MKRLFGLAVVGAACLLGCQTDTSAAGYSSATTTPANVARNPNIASGERGLLIEGTVVADYKDTLIIKDDRGFERTLRVDEQTLFRNEGSGPIAREYLEPGSQVRTAWDNNEKENVAREVIVIHDAGRGEPNAWPEEPSPYR
ncbi:hypothetical protein [Hyalangium rubrum]|uniref:Lipoprotein n=1 Tax=Hyalangium rubrum TaxID=3103134 RepID=A0ABU5H2N5_9BACT|nr:hypothetical protein [Hyalangium sp. s54d21]MDY7227576.1 hypothetical protein [Hyalangium sp. s54d21]